MRIVGKDKHVVDKKLQQMVERQVNVQARLDGRAHEIMNEDRLSKRATEELMGLGDAYSRIFAEDEALYEEYIELFTTE